MLQKPHQLGIFETEIKGISTTNYRVFQPVSSTQKSESSVRNDQVPTNKSAKVIFFWDGKKM